MDQTHRKDTVVIGLGNLLMSDEGIGVHLIRKLSEHQDKYPSVEFIDAGTGVKNVMKLTVAEIQKIRHLQDEYGLIPFNAASISSATSPISFRMGIFCDSSRLTSKPQKK